MSLKNAVISAPTFEKVANLELPKDVSEWNEEILKQFFSTITYLPKDVNVDVVINSMDDNKGYAKGSVVVFYRTRQINFPIIVKEFKLFPFDVFVADVDNKHIFLNATEKNVKNFLMTNEVAEIRNMYDFALVQELKTPGGVAPKPSVPLDAGYHDFVIQDQNTYNMRKLSFWVEKADPADLEKLALQLRAEPNVKESFQDNFGDLQGQVVDLLREKREIMREKQIGKLDLAKAVRAKQALVTLDSDLAKVDDLKPLSAPSVCEIRVMKYPSMEDFMDSGDDAVTRLAATKVGMPVAGILVPFKSIDDCCGAICGGPYREFNDKDKSELEKKRVLREQQDQIFICGHGHHYSIGRDYNKTGVHFYGQELPTPSIMEKIVKNMEQTNVQDFFAFSADNHHTGADKVFNPSELQNQGKRSSGYRREEEVYGLDTRSAYDNGIFILYGAGDAWECTLVTGVAKAYALEGRKIYVTKNDAIVPANVASIQKVSHIQNPVYKMILGKVKNIYLIPEHSVILNRRNMCEIDGEDIMHPSKPVQMAYEKANIMKVAVRLGNEGYLISGAPTNDLYKVAGIDSSVELGTKEAMFVLDTLGAKSRTTEILKTALSRSGEPVTVYGVRSDYINPEFNQPLEKQARIRDLKHQIAMDLRIDLTKEASVIQDPEAVDNVLSLNFINEDNLGDYIDNIQMFKRSISKLASMVLASRMGLADIEESAARKAMDGLESVVEGLEGVKLALGK